MGVKGLSNSVFERRTASGCRLFALLGGHFAQIFEQIVTTTVNDFSKTNVAVSMQIKKEHLPLAVAVRRSKMPLLKRPRNLQRNITVLATLR